MTDTKIFIAAHKTFTPPENPIYIPLHVGAEGKQDLGYTKDNTGDNISSKNASYCELTGMYWMWKNVQCDVIGLVHYRRYFYQGLFPKTYQDILAIEDIDHLLQTDDVIVSDYAITQKTLAEIYDIGHIISDLNITREAIEIFYPDYLDAFDYIMNHKHYSPFNMMITSKEIYDAYCEWLFKILFYVEENLQVPLDGRSQWDMRVFGFLSERLLNIWLLKNSQYKVKRLPVYNTELPKTTQEIREVIKVTASKFIH